MRTIVMDSQILTTFSECSKKFELNFIQNLRSAHVIEPLVKGDVLHTALEAYYKHLMKELEGEQDRRLIHAQGVELAVVEARAKAALNGIDLDMAEEVIDTTLLYFEHFKDDDIVPLAVEEPFVQMIYENPEDELRVLYAGKIDLVATASRYEWLSVPFDNKSQGRNSTPSGRSNQFFGYCNALDSNILIVNRLGFQKSLSTSERFKRYPLSYPKEYREGWVRNTIKWAYKLAWALDNNEFEENLSSCDKYSGCTYKWICESITPEAKEWVIQSRYIVGEKWDPTKVLEMAKDERENIHLTESSRISLSNSNDANGRIEEG